MLQLMLMLFKLSDVCISIILMYRGDGRQISYSQISKLAKCNYCNHVIILF